MNTILCEIFADIPNVTYTFDLIFHVFNILRILYTFINLFICELLSCFSM